MARAGKTYTCPQCGEQSIHGVTCFRCDIFPHDEHGNPPPPLFERQILFRKPADPIAEREANAGGELAALGGYFFSSLARQVRELTKRRRLRARFREPTPIGAAKDGEVQVRGRVEVLEPVRHRHGDEVAAYLFRIHEAGTGGDVAIETQLACGKLLIRDDTGAALLDDDFIAILPAPGQPFPASGNVDVRIQAGDLVDVVGPASLRALPELPSVGRAGFREAPKVLVFDGRPDALVVIRPVQRENAQESHA